MPSWNAIDQEIEEAITSGASCEGVRKKYLSNLADLTKRNVICYYSGWLQKGGDHPEVTITDHDINGFMSAVYELDRPNGLDLLLHTPGGGIEATRAIVEYLRNLFDRDIRVIVPQIAMSAGTMIACSAQSIVMGKQSSLGPFDPQINGFPAAAVRDEIERALEEIKKDPEREKFWKYVFSKFQPTVISSCDQVVTASEKMVARWLATAMFDDDQGAESKAQECVKRLMDTNETSSHAHHFSADDCINFGLNISRLEDDQDLQEAVLSIHHAFMATFNQMASLKIVESQNAQSWVVNA